MKNEDMYAMDRGARTALSLSSSEDHQTHPQKGGEQFSLNEKMLRCRCGGYK